MHSGRTYRAPRHFLFEFTEDKADGAGRLAVWCEGGDFQSWWSDTGVHNTYPQGQGTSAFISSGSFSAGSASQIAALLFANAGLVSTMTELTDMTAAGTEAVGGRPAYKLTGIARSKYPTGHEFNVRRTTVWIDVETLLVRKIFEDTPKASPRERGAARRRPLSRRRTRRSTTAGSGSWCRDRNKVSDGRPGQAVS